MSDLSGVVRGQVPPGFSMKGYLAAKREGWGQQYLDDLVSASEGAEQLTWHPEHVGGGGDTDEGTAYVVVEVDGRSEREACKRALAYLARNYEDDFTGANANVEIEVRAGRYVVRVNLRRPR